MYKAKCFSLFLFCVLSAVFGCAQVIDTTFTTYTPVNDSVYQVRTTTVYAANPALGGVQETSVQTKFVSTSEILSQAWLRAWEQLERRAQAKIVLLNDTKFLQSFTRADAAIRTISANAKNYFSISLEQSGLNFVNVAYNLRISTGATNRVVFNSSGVATIGGIQVQLLILSPSSIRLRTGATEVELFQFQSGHWRSEDGRTRLVRIS